MPLIQRLHKINTINPKNKYSTNAMQGKMGRGSGASGLPEQPQRKCTPLREKVPTHQNRFPPLKTLKNTVVIKR